MKKISIVVPVLNDIRVVRALDSILAQQLSHALEVIVIDAGSTDGTREVLETYRDRLSLLVSEPDAGIYDGMNKGIQRATGEVLGILCADDRYSDPFVLRDVMATFCNDDTDACYGDLAYANQKNSIIRYWKAGKYRHHKWHFGWMPPHPTFFIRRDLYVRYGLFDLRYPIAADYELMLRLLFMHNIRIKYLDRILVTAALGGNSNASLRVIVRANLEIRQIWRDSNLRYGSLVSILKPSCKIFQYLRRP